MYIALGFVTAAIATGAGRHSSTLSHSQVELASILTLVGLTAGALSFTLSKVAVVILLIQLLRPALWHVRFLWTLVGGNLLFMAVAGLVFFLQCRPPQALWSEEAEQSCWDPMIATSLAISTSGKSTLVVSAPVAASQLVSDTCPSMPITAISAFTDFYLALYPAVVLWSLDMSRRKKLALSVALGFGVWCVPTHLVDLFSLSRRCLPVCQCWVGGHIQMHHGLEARRQERLHL